MPHVSMGHALGIAYLIDHPAGDEEVGGDLAPSWISMGSTLDSADLLVHLTLSYLIYLSFHLAIYRANTRAIGHTIGWTHDRLDTRLIGHTIDWTHDRTHN